MLTSLNPSMNATVTALHAHEFAVIWTRIDLAHRIHEAEQGVRYTLSESARHTVLDCLLALNHQRYEEEVKAGLHEKKAKGKRLKAEGKKNAASPQSGLLPDPQNELSLE
jgi:hypothetical protein